MRTILLALLLAATTLSCKNEEDVDPADSLKQKLLGRWEAIETLYTLEDGQEIRYTFGEDGDFLHEYSIGIDYSSGFDLQENNTLDLIWQSTNKGDFYHWELENGTLVIDHGTLVFTVISLDDTTLEFEFDNGKRWYKMKRLH